MADTSKEIEQLRVKLARLEKGQKLLRDKTDLEARVQRIEIDTEKEIREIERKKNEPPELSVNSPTSGTEWKINQPVDINWSSSGLLGKWVRIDLLKRDRLYREIAVTVSMEDGSFSWMPPATLPPADDYSIRLIDHLTGLTGISDKIKISR